ncbi:MAG: tripartite tricarboxylate transporter substrate-binding protein, partial [Comamonas sp.]
MFRPLITATAVACAFTASFASAAQPAAEYPTKPIRMVIPFPPGGGTDILARVVANKLTEVTKWTVVPENKAGAGGTIGISDAAKSAPTGYDMVMGQKDNLVLG